VAAWRPLEGREERVEIRRGKDSGPGQTVLKAVLSLFPVYFLLSFANSSFANLDKTATFDNLVFVYSGGSHFVSGQE